MASKKTKAKKKAPPPNPVGIGRAKGKRPNVLKIIDDKLEALFDWIADGKTIRAFCSEQGVSRTQVHERLKSKELAEHLARARAVGALQLEDEIMKIADEPTVPDDPDDMQRRKIRIHARTQRLVWNDPKKYGTKTVVEGNITHKVELSDKARDIRIEQLLDKARTPEVTVEIHEDKETDE